MMYLKKEERTWYYQIRETELRAAAGENPPLHLELINLLPEQAMTTAAQVLDLWAACRDLEALVEQNCSMRGASVEAHDNDIIAAAEAVAAIIGYCVEDDPFVDGSSIIIVAPDRDQGVFVDLTSLGNLVHIQPSLAEYFRAEMMDRWANTEWPSPLGFARNLRQWPRGKEIVREAWVALGSPRPWRPEGREWEEAREMGYVK